MQEIKKQIELIQEEVESLKKILKVKEKEEKMRSLQLKMSEPGFWANSKYASEVVADLKSLKNDVDDWHDLNSQLTDLKEIASIGDSALESNISKEVNKIKADCEKMRLKIVFSGKFDKANAIVEINSGAGGTEACDWAAMLFRMYFRWSENNKFKLKVLGEERGDEAGIKSITFFISGTRAYGLLKAERGVHRLVRISPFDANKRRHTSFASVNVLPEVKDDVDIEIKPEEIRIDTYRSSGAGGQHVNVTDSAVRITHLPSGIVVACQNERSQYQNKISAMGILKAKLYGLKEMEERKQLENMVGQKQKIEWGSQIRSYILHPYLLVKDHRSNLEKHNAWEVLDGDIDDFIYAYLNLKVKSA